MSKKLLVMYLVSFLVCLSVLYARPPVWEERMCSCRYHDGLKDEWCKQWCGEDEEGKCKGEVWLWGCWCKDPGNSWICNCGYWVLCDDLYARYHGAGCDNTYCGW